MRAWQDPMLVLVADRLYGHRLLVELVAASDPDVEVVAATASGRIAAELCEQMQPDVAIIASPLPVIDGRELVPLLRVLAPRTRIILWSDEEHGLEVDGRLSRSARTGDVADMLRAMGELVRQRSALSGHHHPDRR